MTYRTPTDVKDEFRAHPRRALILTTVVFESRAVGAHLAHTETIIGEKDALYEFGRFPDPAGDWLIVHAITSSGNIDAGLVASKAFQEFGHFHAQIFVGIAGSLKEDIPIGSVVIGDYVYNGHSAKVEDDEILSRPHGLASARELLSAARGLIYSDEWRNLIRSPVGIALPSPADYPCAFPPSAVIKGIVSGEEVVAGNKSSRFALLRSHFNDCGAVEMEGWGAMSAAHCENASAIIVRGISDMCAGKEHTKDAKYQPIAAAHAAAFAFSILSFRSKVPTTKGPVLDGEANRAATVVATASPPHEERRVEFVFNFDGTMEAWPKETIEAVVERLKQAIGDENLKLIRIEGGSVRLVVSVRECDLEAMDLAKIRDLVSDCGVTLLGATPWSVVAEAEKSKAALAAASVGLLVWEKTLPNGRWIERPEREGIEARFELPTSSTVLLGEPGSGKSALLSTIASDLLDRGAAVFALKADFLPIAVRTEADLQRELELPGPPSDLILRLAALQPVYVLIDQLDALASQVDLKSGRLNVLLNLVRRLGRVQNVHILLSARAFEFDHDVRLRAIEAEPVTLALPPWHEVRERLNEVGINADSWPERARDVVRIPQALKTFLALVSSGRKEPFSTYQAMLEQLWGDRVASADDSERLIQLASDLAGQMAEEESLWLAASRFDERLSTLKRLEALGLIVRSENSLSIAFSHQTVFDYVLARTFVRSAGLLSTYVLDRQESLFVRAKVWSSLNYLREAEVNAYERELLAIWTTKNLRRHLRLLLIEFLGQVAQPLETEKQCMVEALSSPDLRIVALKAIGGSSGWFDHFASTAIRDAMSGSVAEANHAARALGHNWKTDDDRVVRLINERWLPHPESDGYTWMVVSECHHWTEEVERIAATVLTRSKISEGHVMHSAMTLAVTQPEVAFRLVRGKLDYLLSEATRQPAPPPFPVNGTDADETAWHLRYGKGKEFLGLLEEMGWSDLPSLAEASPAAFLNNLWPWYTSVFSEIVARKDSGVVTYVYPGRYYLEIEMTPSEAHSVSREKPLMSALQVAVEELAANSPDEFLKWAKGNSSFEILVVQQLIARGYETAGERLASEALKWLLLDLRRFQLGTCYGHRRTTIDLVTACVPHWSKEEIDGFEKAVRNYRPQRPEHLEGSDRKLFSDIVRATKKDLLLAVGVERLTPESQALVATEQRALGDRFDRSISYAEGGVIGSPMEAAAMTRAKDRDILKIFREVPDNANWDHPTQWMRGGNIQLSRAFAAFARTDPERAIRVMEQFEPLQQERAAGYSLEAMADDEANDCRVVEVFLDLCARGFQSDDFRDSAARAIEKLANRKSDVGDEVVAVLVDWLSLAPALSELGTEDEEIEPDASSRNAEEIEGSILWGFGGSIVLPNGNFNILAALASVLLGKNEAGRDRYFAILDEHFAREPNPNIWKALLYRFGNAGGSTPQIVSSFLRKLFARFPEILATREVVIFLAHAQRWDQQLVFDLICDWRKSDQPFLQQAYGELVGLVAATNSTSSWLRAREEIITSESDHMKIGLAYSAVNMWSDEKLRLTACETLVALLKESSKDVVAAVMDVFRLTDELTPDLSTSRLLRALADPSADMSAAPSQYVVERLQTLLPHEAELIATIAEKLVAAWRGELGDFRTATSTAAPQLTDLAITLHRLGGASRQSGVTLFEAISPARSAPVKFLNRSSARQLGVADRVLDVPVPEVVLQGAQCRGNNPNRRWRA
jgi:nucleoside phosphorylase